MATATAINALSILTTTADFSAPVEGMSLLAQVEAYSTAAYVEDAAKSRRDALRDALMKAAQAEGKLNDKGGHRLEVEGHTIRRERRVSSTPDEKSLMSLLEKKSLNIEQAFDKVVVLQPNPSKVNALVESGHLTREEADALYKQTFALVVQASRELEALLENAIPATLSAPKKRR